MLWLNKVTLFVVCFFKDFALALYLSSTTNLSSQLVDMERGTVTAGLHSNFQLYKFKLLLPPSLLTILAFPTCYVQLAGCSAVAHLVQHFGFLWKENKTQNPTLRKTS